MRNLRPPRVVSIGTHPRTMRSADRFDAKGIVIQFPTHARLPEGIYELNREGVVTAFNPSRGSVEGVIGRNFFTEVAPGLSGRWNRYAWCYEGGVSDWDEYLRGYGEIPFVRVLDAVAVIVNRERGEE